MGNAVGSTASLASSSSGMENGQWSYPSSSQVIQAPPESTALCYENEKTNHRLKHKGVDSGGACITWLDDGYDH
jgi:hypothetical protein